MNHDAAIILLVGGAGAGKDTVAQILQTTYDYHPIALATPIKTFVDALLGPGKHRQVYQQIGDVMRGADPSVFIQEVRRRIADHPDWRWVVTDVRYPNELRMLSAGGIPPRVWFIDAPFLVRLDRLRQRDGHSDPIAFTHSSEQVHQLREFCHATIDNSGDLSALRQQIQYLLQNTQV